MKTPLAIGVDIGGTSTRVALIENGLIFDSRREPTPRDGEPDELKYMLGQLATAIRSNYDDLGPTDSVPIGVGMPGIRDATNGVMKRCVNLPRLVGLNIPEFLQEAFDQPALIETDVNAAAFAQWEAVSPRVNRFAYLSLGTGVGGGVILDGQILRHTNNSAGHFGFLLVAPSSITAGRTGVPGSLEALAAGPALAHADSATIRAAVHAVAVGLHQLNCIYLPDAIAVGGGVIDHLPDLATRIELEFHDRPTLGLERPPVIMRAPLRSDDAGVIGAAALALRAKSNAS